MTRNAPVREESVPSGEIELAVQSRGDPSLPTVVLVHGFPDNHAVWDLVADRLSTEFHVVTYDVRGAGGSSAPSSRAGYRMDRLVDDLVAVIDTTSPDKPVQLVGHDWGSVQAWGAVVREEDDPRLRGRIASYTSISGPCLEHFGGFVRRSIRGRRWSLLGRQLAHSWYIGAFQVPWLPEATFRRFGDRIQARLARTERLHDSAHWSDSFVRDASNGVNLYRANMRRGAQGPARARTRVPVQLIVPLHDEFLTPAVYDDLASYVADLTRVDVDAGHWLPRTEPDLVARQISGFARV